ncbi:oxidoreductase [Nocardioides sp. GY 10113]|uniref:oxidoreductase n=1 Tax=Nocardioides sp. GY 10113 TaxID=2569761 RepID=UPI0010A90E15|nr:oxidoreductase [Nocardioides sp. GY 10113]TIC85093.1 oxidoreductase [Nocardioides sp. GY 10113]
MNADPLAWLLSLEGVPSALASARDGIDVVLRDRGLRRTSPETTAESLLRGAHASAVLEGSASSLAEIREGAADEIAADAVRVSTELLGLVPVIRTQPLQALARLHALAAQASLPADRLGRPRDADAATTLRALASMITARTEAPALALAAIVHADLATAAPFGSHNGIVARAAERLLLAARGVDEKSLVVPEAAHLALRAQYESNLRGWASGNAAGRHAWLLYAAEAYAAAAEASPLRRAAED